MKILGITIRLNTIIHWGMTLILSAITASHMNSSERNDLLREIGQVTACMITDEIANNARIGPPKPDDNEDF